MKLTKITEDNRGYTHILEDDNLGCPELAIHFTKEGFARGGCIHSKDEYLSVVSGKINLVCGDNFFELKAGEIVLIPKETPHYLMALSDSVVLEWGTSAEDKKNKDEYFRNIVDRINDNKHI